MCINKSLESFHKALEDVSEVFASLNKAFEGTSNDGGPSQCPQGLYSIPSDVIDTLKGLHKSLNGLIAALQSFIKAL